MDGLRREVSESRTLPGLGRVERGASGSLPWVVTGRTGDEIEPVSTFLRDLMLTDMSPLTARSSAADLLRWWRMLDILASWESVTRSEVEMLVGWMRCAPNRQWDRQRAGSPPAGAVNVRAFKPALRVGCAPSSINHALSMLSSVYALPRPVQVGPVTNPVPTNAARRARLAHRSPL